jgi:hypothetical protein
MKLVNFCSRKLDEAEQKVTMLIKDQSGKYSQQPFEAEKKRTTDLGPENLPGEKKSGGGRSVEGAFSCPSGVLPPKWSRPWSTASLQGERG